MKDKAWFLTPPSLLFFFLLAVPVSVNSPQCEPVAKQPVLMLKWKCPSGNNSGFKIRISNTSKEELAPPCAGEGIEQTFPTTSPLNFFSTYNVTIITRSNGPDSSPVDILCHTSITGKHWDLRMKNTCRTKILTSWLQSGRLGMHYIISLQIMNKTLH